jgi:hypothetical protein
VSGLLTGAHLEAALRDDVRYSVFRLETLQEYRGSGEDAWISAFNDGDPGPPPDPAQDDWEALVRAHRRAGRLMQRVHVVTEPLTDYMRFELTWAYAPNVAAGEDIRIVPVGPDRPWPADLPHEDFWLFDSSVLYAARYADDGYWLGVESVTDPTAIVAACRWRDAALHLAQLWADYVATRPSLVDRLPAP